ncbi:MAG: PTS sugar transporter subunit IIB [Lachnospiraceae bacterium]|jgi:PTS system mannose-specific IIB component|uniref:PTS system mannose/fructose/N-acetylgalactosamine-transporter subunit IIB n=1 Tax=Candidatus Merdisoma sp. JLR.KK006 TaxID=3112626 RepID=UPI002FEEFADA|nr:PTS sugar transporter subunit IIB [Lachnospiraceae bacterium]
MRKEIVNVRIDERLIHGQIAAAWTGYLKVDRIMVIDAAAAKTEIQKIALKMACPQGLKLSILSPAKAVENINSGKYEKERVFIVVKGTETLKSIVEAGLKLDVVNVGNISGKTNTRFVKKAVNVTPEDEKVFQELSAEIRFTSQLVPTDPELDFMELLKG